MRKVSLSWAEDSCGNRPDYYQIMVNGAVIGTTTETTYYHENYEDRGVLTYQVRAVNQYGVSAPTEASIGEVVANFSGQRWDYTFNGEDVSGVFLSTGPQNLTATVS
jgi:hypothetical protein